MFDPYREWLGMADDRRPPTLYQILGIANTEIDPRMIEAAVSRQLAKVQNHIAGSYSKEAWRLIDEITLAKTTLLDPVKRSAYDSIFGAPKPAAPVANGWAQAAAAYAPPPPAPAFYQPPPPPAPVASYQPPAPAPVFYQPPPAAAPMPKAYQPPVRHVASPFEDHDPPSADGALPTPDAMPKPRSRAKGGNSSVIFIGGGILALGLVAGVIFMATKGNSKTDEGDKKETEVAKGQHDPKTDHPVNHGTGKEKEPAKTKQPEEKKKKGPPKKQPMPDPPPPIEIAEEFKQAKLLRANAGTPRATAVSPDGKLLLMGGSEDDFGVFSFSPLTDRPSRRMNLTSPVYAVGFMPGGKEAIVVYGATTAIVDLTTNKERKKFENSAGGARAFAVAADGKHILTASTDGQLRWWDVTKDTPERAIDASEKPLSCVALASDGKTAIVGCDDGTVSLCNLASGGVVKKWRVHLKGVESVAFSPDGTRIVTSGFDKENLVRVWDLVGTPIMTLKGHKDTPIAAGYSPDGSLIVTASLDSTVRGWDAVTGEEQRWAFKSEAKVQSLAFDPKNRFVLAGLGDGGLQLLFLPAVRPDSPPRGAWVQAPKPPLPLPTPILVESAVKTIREKYKNDYALTAPEDQLALFDKLLIRAKVAPEEPTTRFALFQEARDLAGKLGRMPEAFKAVDARSTWFDADDLADKWMALKAASQGTVNKNVVVAALGVVEDAEKQTRPDIVDELLRVPELFPQLPDEADLNAKVTAARNRWTSAATEREKIRAMAADLKKDPDGPAVNAAYGKHLCFRVGDWAEGLPRVLKGDDAALKDLAKRDAADPKEAKDQVELGKGWLDYATKADDLLKPGILIRARSWYEKAIAGNKLPNNEKLPANAKINEINKLIAGVGLITLARPGEPVIRRGFNTLRNSTALESQWVLTNIDSLMGDELPIKADGSMTSRFRLLDGCRVDFSFIPDGRMVKVQLNGEEVTFKPEAGASPVMLTVERKGNELKFALKAFTGGILEEKSAALAGAKLDPTPITFAVQGKSDKDGMKMKSIVVSGGVKPTE